MNKKPDWKFDAVTVLEGYRAMISFLDAYWRRGKSDEIACLLSILQLDPDLNSADPAMKEDWLEAIDEVRRRRPGSS